MGEQSPWLAFVGEHDEFDAHSTLVFAHAPENDDAIHESHWFVRTTATPTVAFSWAFFEEFALPPGRASGTGTAWSSPTGRGTTSGSSGT